MPRIKNIKQVIFDADDTLWENNVFFVRTMENIFFLFEEADVPRIQISDEFRQIEQQVVKSRGYGSDNFIYIMKTLLKKHMGNGIKTPDINKFNQEMEKFQNHRKQKPVLFNNVLETLSYLKSKYPLYVLTKGNFDEQKKKLLRSGIIPYLDKYYILPEKEDLTYKNLLEQNNWLPQQTIMVGNSPKSDINPALRNGMYAVFIPYEYTWHLDNERISNDNSRLITVAEFTDLRKFL